VATPVLALPRSGGAWVNAIRSTPTAWAQKLDDVFHVAPVTAEGAGALFALLASEIFSYQLCVLGVAVIAVLSSLIVYLFPITEATALMILNLVALVLCGGYAAYQTVAFEGDQILSNVLCNRPQTREWSVALFAGVAIPFVALTIVIGIGQVPGVLDVGYGLLDALLKAFKLG